MASVTIVCRVRFSKNGAGRLPQGDVSYSFPAHTAPIFFDLWLCCPAVMLALPGCAEPFVDMDAPLISLPSHFFVAREWAPKYKAVRLKFKTRIFAMLRAVIAKQLSDLRVEDLRSATRDQQLADTITYLERVFTTLDLLLED